MKKKYIIVSIISVIVILIILIVGVVLYNTTDLFKSESQMFRKYFKQSTQSINKIVDFSDEERYINILKENNYLDNSSVKLIYKNSHGNLEEFNSNISGVTNNSNKKSYRKINVKYSNGIDVINTEFLNENGIYGILLSDVVGQYASIDSNNMNVLLNNLNIKEQDLKKYNIQEIMRALKDKKERLENICFEFSDTIKNNQFTVEENRDITLNDGKNITTNAYILKLNSNQTKKLLVNLLKEIGNTELIQDINNKNEIPELTIKIHVSNGEVVRIVSDFDSQEIRLDFYHNELDFKYTSISYNAIETIDLSIKEDENKRYIQYKDSKNNNIKIEYDIQETDKNVLSNIAFEIKNKYIQSLQLILNQKIELNDNASVTKGFEDTKNVILNNLDAQTLNVALNGLAKRVNVKLMLAQENIKSELLNAWIEKNNDLQNNYQELKNKEKENFNNQFISYEGKNINQDIVYNLLEIVRNNILKYEEDEEGNIKIYLEQGKINNEMIAEIKEKISKNSKKFNITLEYNLDGKVSNILIQESTEKN